jgi:hypothetical protein
LGFRTAFGKAVFEATGQQEKKNQYSRTAKEDVSPLRVLINAGKENMSVSYSVLHASF